VYRELVCQQFVSVKITGCRDISGAVEISYFDPVYGRLVSCGVGYHVSCACALRKTSRTRIGGSYELRHGKRALSH
jgi:hypothetical protein